MTYRSPPPVSVEDWIEKPPAQKISDDVLAYGRAVGYAVYPSAAATAAMAFVAPRREFLCLLEKAPALKQHFIDQHRHGIIDGAFRALREGQPETLQHIFSFYQDNITATQTEPRYDKHQRVVLKRLLINGASAEDIALAVGKLSDDVRPRFRQRVIAAVLSDFDLDHPSRVVLENARDLIFNAAVARIRRPGPLLA